MSAYISEIQFFGDTTKEFVEVAVPTGTDVSGYTLHMYGFDGTVWNTFTLGSYAATMEGHDVYVLDDTTSGFTSGDSSGNFYADDALALVDGNGNVVQFISWYGNTVTATNGPASGTTSNNIGSSNGEDSLQSNDGGATYFSQSKQNPGRIPACYGRGTMIATPNGQVRVEDLKVGDKVLSAQYEPMTIKWIWSDLQIFRNEELHQMPVLIRKGAFGAQMPSKDLVVSGQHRMAVGVNGQLNDVFAEPVFVPAKALVGMQGVSFLTEARSIEWYHIVCDDHALIWANDVLSETMLLGPLVLEQMNGKERMLLSHSLEAALCPVSASRMALKCLSVGEAKQRLNGLMQMKQMHRPCQTLH